MRISSDILIIGSGVAGLTTAIHLAESRPDLSITVLTKTTERKTNTSYAQGGIAAVWDLASDTFEKHIADTLTAGDGLCDPEVVEIVIKEGRERVEEMIGWGARFDREKQEYDLGREGGHSENRILHFKDITGWEIQRTLSEKVATYNNVTILEHYFALDLLTQHHLGHQITRATPDISCYGVYAFNRTTKSVETLLARATVIATGGAGQIYKATTNPVIATGDGIAMAYRAKGRVANMEFVQFHPTALYDIAGESPSFLISEAVRGEGAILKNYDGQEFMHQYDPRGSLAPRDIVARAIDNEMKKSGQEHVFLDATLLKNDVLDQHFPNITQKCQSKGINPHSDLIPVLPACHYICGGIDTGKYGETSISGLYAAGECTNSGLHGANRLASNSLLEGLVFGERVHRQILTKIDAFQLKEDIPDWNITGTLSPKEMVLITQSHKELKEIMSSYVGIVRSNVRLDRALNRLHILYTETEYLYKNTAISQQLCELRNLITIAYLVTRSAQMRKESRGLHHTTDYPLQYPFIDQTYI